MRNHPQYNHRRNGLITPPIVDARMVQSKFNAAKERPCSYKSHSFPFLMMILRTSPAQLNSRLKNMKENSNKTLIFCSMLIEKDLKYCKMTIDYIYSQSMVKMVFTKKHFIIKRIKTNKIFVFVGETAQSQSCRFCSAHSHNLPTNASVNSDHLWIKPAAAAFMSSVPPFFIYRRFPHSSQA